MKTLSKYLLVLGIANAAAERGGEGSFLSAALSEPCPTMHCPSDIHTHTHTHTRCVSILGAFALAAPFPSVLGLRILHARTRVASLVSAQTFRKAL